MEQLLVRLGSRFDEPVHWLVWSGSEQEIIASGVLPSAEALSTLTERAGRRPVIALAPTSDILLKWVTLPPRAGRKVRAAIPYMLEDELAQDVAKQFFAFGPKEGDQQSVAVVSHQQMQQWQLWLAEAGLDCEKLLPDVLAVPHNEEGWALLTLGDNVLLREDRWTGLQGESTWLLPALQHKLRNQTAPVQVKNYSELAVDSLPNINEDKAQLDLPMRVLAQEAIQNTFNLLQGDYRIKRKRSGRWYEWRIAAVLAVVALTAGLIDKSLALYQLKQENARLDAQIDDAVATGFPDLGSYRDIRRKLESEMAQLKTGGGGLSMLVMMQQLTGAFAASDVKPQTLRFDAARGELRMQAIGRNFEALEQFRRQAEQAGFSVEQGAINNRDEAVIGTVAIRSQS